MPAVTDPNAAQRAYWDARHHRRDYAHPSVCAFAEQRLDYLQRFVPAAEVRSALEVGCGDGFMTYYAAQRLDGLLAGDRSRAMLGRHPLQGRLAQFDALALPFADGTFDLVFSCELLHHIADPVTAVRELARVSRRYVVLFEPNRNNPLQLLIALLKPSERWTVHYSPRFVRGLAPAAGLDIVQADVAGWIFPKRIPAALVPAMRRLPFVTPVVGISNVVICRKRPG